MIEILDEWPQQVTHRRSEFLLGLLDGKIRAITLDEAPYKTLDGLRNAVREYGARRGYMVLAKQFTLDHIGRCLVVQGWPADEEDECGG